MLSRSHGRVRALDLPTARQSMQAKLLAGSQYTMKSIPGRTQTEQLVVSPEKKQRHHHENCQLQSNRNTTDIRAQRDMSTMNGTSTIDGQAEKPVHVSKEPVRRAKVSVTRCYAKDSYSPGSYNDCYTSYPFQTEQ